MVSEQDIARVRSFNRLVTRQVGALNDRYLGHRPLGESRVLFEIGAGGATPRDVRARLGLDSGYLSRMLAALERDGLVETEPNPADRRTRRLRLTAAGRAEMRELNRVSDELAASALAPLDAGQRERLLRAQAEVRRLLAISMVTIERADPSSSDARWCLGHYFAELAGRFEEDFDPSRTLPALDLDAFLIARLSGQPAACGVLRTLRPGVGEILRMWVDRPHRGLGIGARMLDALEAEAVALGHGSVRLYTNRSLAEAKAMYRARGYAEIARYNDDPYANHWFEKRLAAGRVGDQDGEVGDERDDADDGGRAGDAGLRRAASEHHAADREHRREPAPVGGREQESEQ
jgi:DNA-binding MarR family transcriptional regulator/N-acetylglutamate synthase-like GNAT family acetyltransferase